ncbi:hypothetical protein [Nocardioides sp. URHA0020]|uniref:hypothetical protein n=1 Tax=Nocardioides sp. URHA0020 TaxID=1380392 RepID=UPI0012DEC881|nr:hypothetical protein [Nocardioides sp. URHA0020]
MSRPTLHRPSPRWQAVLVALALVVAFSGGAAAKGKYDAKNAHRVDGKHAVGSGASVTARKGRLVATSPKTGQLPSNIISRAPDSLRLGGYSHRAMSAMTIVPQGVGHTGGATLDSDGVTFSPSAGGEMRLGVVIPPDHDPKAPLRIDVVYREDSPGACSWSVGTSGLEGPDSDTGSDIHNGGWQFPGSGSGYSGLVTVPAGAGSVHTLTLTWPFQDDPGMFVQLGLARAGGDAGDTCSTVSVYGIQLRY